MNEPKIIETERTDTEGLVEHRLDLAEGEEVLFERDHVVLTNLRLMADWSSGRAKSIVAVKDIDGVRRLKGGQDSRLGSGIKIFGVGAVLMAIQLLVERFVVTAVANSALNILNVIFFVIAAVVLGVGLHVIVTSLVRVKPHTSLLFVRFKHKDILVSFPGHQSEDAEKLRAAFNRQQRAIPF